MATQIHVKQVEVAEIDALRDLYCQEMNCQIVHDSYQGGEHLVYEAIQDDYRQVWN